MPPPEGLALRREDVPALFDAVDEIVARLRTPPVHRILLTGQFNAAMAQVPRFGLLGWHRNHLMLGLPMMLAMSPEQLRAVIAHELGHLSRNHSRFSGWIHRVRGTWANVLQSLQDESHWSTAPLRRFFQWYAPRFDAHSFVLARSNEYVADRCSADLTDSRTAADALLVSNLRGAYLESMFWPDIDRLASAQAEPPRDVFVRMATALSQELEIERAERWLSKVMQVPTSTDDTHPSLVDRLEALEEAARVPVRPSLSAAEGLLGEQLLELSRQMSENWANTARGPWSRTHRQAREDISRLSALETLATERPLTAKERWEQTCLTEILRGVESAVSLCKETLLLEPDHAGANFLFGRTLLERGEETGIEHLERAILSDPRATIPACTLMIRHLESRGRDREAVGHRVRIQRRLADEEHARQERSRITEADVFTKHSMRAADIAHLREVLRARPEVARARIARRQVVHMREIDMHVLCVQPRTHLFQRNRRAKAERLCAEIAESVRLPHHEIYVFSWTELTPTIQTRLAVVQGSLFFTR
jgi:Zn-dependent protease with chaperone function